MTKSNDEIEAALDWLADRIHYECHCGSWITPEQFFNHPTEKIYETILHALRNRPEVVTVLQFNDLTGLPADRFMKMFPNGLIIKEDKA